MAANYEVNIVLNTKDLDRQLGDLDTKIAKIGTGKGGRGSSRAQFAQQNSHIKSYIRHEERRVDLQIKNNSLRHKLNTLEIKGLNILKLRKGDEASLASFQNQQSQYTRKQTNEQFGLTKVVGKKLDLEIAKTNQKIANEKLILRLQRQQAAEVSKTQQQGLGLMSLGDKAGRIGGRISDATTPKTRGPGGRMLALPSSDMLSQRLVGSGQLGMGSRMPTGLSRLFTGFDKQSALISGAFPLLFGQNPLVAGAGALGGGFGGKIGGQMGGFAGGLAATAAAGAAVAAVNAVVQSTRELGEALTTTKGTFDIMTKRTLFSSDAVEAQARSLMKQGKQTELAKLLSDDLAKSLGVNAVGQLKELGENSKEAARQWAILTTQLQLLVAGPLADMLRMMTEVLSRQTAERSLGQSLDAIRAKDPNRANELAAQITNDRDWRERARGSFLYGNRGDVVGGKGPLGIGGANIGGMSDEKLSGWVAELQKVMKGMGIGGDTVGGGVLDKFAGGSSKDVIGNLDKQISLLKTKGRLTESQFKIERDIIKLQEKGTTFNEEEYRQKATLLKRLEEQRRLYLEIAQTIKGGIVDGIEAAITGARSLGDVLRSITQSVGRSFLNAAVNAGVGALTSSWGNNMGGRYGGQSGPLASTPPPLPAIPNAEGGFYTGPTNALVAEAGESEYIIPESKMGDALAKYAGGARGDAVLAGGGGDGETGGISGGANGSIDVTFNTQVINDVSYVSYAEFQAGVQQAAVEGAKRGEQATLRRLQTSPSTRRRVGV